MVIPNLTKSARTDSLSSLLEQIDKKLYYLSQIEYSHITYGIDSNVNYNDVEDLLTYRDIVVYKMKGCNCYDTFPTTLIVSKIKKLVR